MATPRVKINPSLVGLLAGKDTATMIVSLVRTMPTADRAALAIGGRGVRVQTELASLEQTIDAQPVEELRRLRNGRLCDAALRQQMLDERDAAIRKLASVSHQ